MKISGDGVPNAQSFAPPVKISSPTAGATVGTKPTVSGSAEPDAKVTFTAVDTAVCTATAGHDGAWTCTATSSLTTGAHTLIATAKDVTGTPAKEATVLVTVG